MSSPEASRRLFTIEEANQRLPLVSAIVQDIVSLYKEVLDRRERLTRVRGLRGDQTPGPLYADELEQVETELQREEDKLAGYVRELHELGVEFKDPVKGLVDFPGMLNGRVVYFCWKHGESEVQFWHELDAGFDGRQSLLAESISSDTSGN